MDIKWKVQVLDKMFDDTYVRNLYLKMKYGTLGRFSFDIRDFGTVEVESYFAVGNTIRIFWGDILKMEGVIQKLVKSTTSWGWSIYGCDLNGLLLDRTPNMPYELGCDTLTIANSVMYAGCDFPTSMWGVGDGEEQGAYVLRYKVGLNTAYKQLRNLPHDLTWQTSTGGEGGTVSSVTTTSIVDNTKNWVVDQWKGAHCRMVTGVKKNVVYEVTSNTENALTMRVLSPYPLWTPEDAVFVFSFSPDTAETYVAPYDAEYNYTNEGAPGTHVLIQFDYYWETYVLPTEPPGYLVVFPDWTYTIYSPSGGVLFTGYSLEPMYNAYMFESLNGTANVVVKCANKTADGSWENVESGYEYNRLHPEDFAGGWMHMYQHAMDYSTGRTIYFDMTVRCVSKTPTNTLTNPVAPDIKIGDIYELTQGHVMTWTKKYKVTPITMTKNTHVINYNHTKDASKTHNSISVSGRDDKGGQIYTSLDDSSPITTLLSQESILSAPISASDTTIPVHDTTGFASSGEAWIE